MHQCSPENNIKISIKVENKRLLNASILTHLHLKLNVPNFGSKVLFQNGELKEDVDVVDI
jgi:hypothetical protein